MQTINNDKCSVWWINVENWLIQECVIWNPRNCECECDKA